MADSVSLSSVQLIIDSQLPSKEFLAKAFTDGGMNLEYEGTWHSIECQTIEDRFYWLYSNFGRVMPHRDIVIDTETSEELENPRTVNQVEPNNQFFAIYDFAQSSLYISNLHKKSFLKYYLEQYASDLEVIIKNSYRTIEQFLDTINSVETIKFTGEKNLFSSGGDLMEPLKNIFGYGEPEDFSIEANYRTPLRDKLRQGILNLAGKQTDGRLKTLVCIGKDDSGFEAIFNTNSFVSKLSIPAQKDEQDLFLPEEVREQSIIKLKRMLNV